MQNNEYTFFFAKSISELFHQIKSVSGIKVVGGCTYEENSSDKYISTYTIEELRQFSLHERYFDCGPGVSLSDILSISSARIPDVLIQSIRSIANPFVRNVATIGGNICAQGRKLTLYATLLALDTRLELKSLTETKNIPLINFTGVPQGFILSNIRIPLSEWNVVIFRRLGPDHKITDASASFVFLADNEKNVITNIKLAFSGDITFRCIEFENRLIGTHLPLISKDINALIEIAGTQFDKVAEGKSYNKILRKQFINLTRYSLGQLT